MPQYKKQKKFLDISSNKQQRNVADFRAALGKTKVTSTLFSKGGRTQSFFTEDSKLYITPRQQALLAKGIEFDGGVHNWDGLSARIVTKFVRYEPTGTSLLLEALEKRYEMFNDATIDAARTLSGQFSMVRLWNASIVGSILFGMVMMTFVYRYLGQGAAAKQLASTTNVEQQIPKQQEAVLGVADTKDDAQSFAQQVARLEQIKSTESLEEEIAAMVKGYPIEKMAPYIAQQDRTVAAFVVSIAKKESAWGTRVPVLNGQDCYNYWGYRGKRKLMGTGGHTCFNSPLDAVETVSKRIKTLVEEQGKDTPAEMVKTWKCGGNCEATGGKAAADKWAIDVDSIFKKFGKEE
jgi:hypothetical protein